MPRTPKVGDVVHVFTKDAARQSNRAGEGPYAASCTPDGSQTRWAFPPAD